MKCPKCQYFSFDNGDRCRNCGYDFSLVPDAPADLPIHDGTEAVGPLGDFSLHDAPALPLFPREAGDSDAPLVASGAAPRPPLAVRRAKPNVGPPRARREPARTDIDPAPRLALDSAEMPVVPEPAVAREATPPEPSPPEPASVAASAGARLGGALVDLVLTLGIDAVVVYFTLKICDLTFGQVLSLPLAPLICFLALLNGGYVATFVAAGGQTIGKMAAGTRVVPVDPAAPVSERVSFGQSVVRAAGYLVSALPLGLGFLPAFFGDRRALHDRLADTRVIKA